MEMLPVPVPVAAVQSVTAMLKVQVALETGMSGLSEPGRVMVSSETVYVLFGWMEGMEIG